MVTKIDFGEILDAARKVFSEDTISYVGNGMYKINGFGYANENFVKKLYHELLKMSKLQ